MLTDRINVGGNESGQQSAYVGPGSAGDQAIWSVDGVVITDMAALGSSPSYFDFDAFEEMQVTTGGSDSTIATGGVVLNMVTKRGTNEWRGSGRFYKTSDSYQSNTSFSDGDLSAGNCTPATPCAYRSGTGATRSQLVQFQLGLLGAPPAAHFTQGNQIISVDDYGAELGGPIIKDRLWVWGSYGPPEGVPPHHRRRQRQDRPQDLQRQAERSDCLQQLGDRLHPQQRQGEDRP